MQVWVRVHRVTQQAIYYIAALICFQKFTRHLTREHVEDMFASRVIIIKGKRVLPVFLSPQLAGLGKLSTDDGNTNEYVI